MPNNVIVVVNDQEADGLPERMHWKVNTPGLIEEVMTNSGTAILRTPLVIFKLLLSEVGDRAAAINDPALNALMMRLAIYSVADPNSKDYDPVLTAEYIDRHSI
jgi:hypothetical protein